jgi:hypothetical protein
MLEKIAIAVLSFTVLGMSLWVSHEIHHGALLESELVSANYPHGKLWITCFHCTTNDEYYRLLKESQGKKFSAHDEAFGALWSQLAIDSKSVYYKADRLTDTEILTELKALNEREAAIELLEGSEFDHPLMHKAYVAACNRLGVKPVKGHE